MESKAEQVKALLWEYDSVRSITTNEIAQRIDALYTSPEVPQQVVCEKAQMMICPSYPEQDKSLCNQCHHFHEHIFEKGNCDTHLKYCKGCIPVPQPEPALLLTFAELLEFQNKWIEDGGAFTNLFSDICKAQLAKITSKYTLILKEN